MKISVKSLREMEACPDGITAFEKEYGDQEVDHTEALLRFADIAPGHSIWWLTRTFNKAQNVKLAIYAAELALPLWEEKHPYNDRHRKAIEAAKAWLENPTEENRIAAWAAACAANASAAAYAAAYAAANAAYTAANAAYAAASAAAYAAANAATAASAAANAAYAAANAANAAVAKKEIYRKIILRGIEILEEVKK